MVITTQWGRGGLVNSRSNNDRTHLIYWFSFGSIYLCLINIYIYIIFESRRMDYTYLTHDSMPSFTSVRLTISLCSTTGVVLWQLNLMRRSSVCPGMFPAISSLEQLTNSCNSWIYLSKREEMTIQGGGNRRLGGGLKCSVGGSISRSIDNTYGSLDFHVLPQLISITDQTHLNLSTSPPLMGSHVWYQ